MERVRERNMNLKKNDRVKHERKKEKKNKGIKNLESIKRNAKIMT